MLRAKLTEAQVLAAFRHLTRGPVRRYELPRLCALAFVIENALGGGVTRSPAIDPLGKGLSSLMLDDRAARLIAPPGWSRRPAGRAARLIAPPD